MIHFDALGHALRAGARRHADVLLGAVDMVLVTAAWVLALVLRYEQDVPPHAWQGLWRLLVVVVPVTVGTHVLAGLYSGVWRHAGVYEARRIVLAQSISLAVSLPVSLLLGHVVPLSVPVLAMLIGCSLVGAVRFRHRLFTVRRRVRTSSDDIVVIGAGDAGASLAYEMNRTPGGGRVVAFLDDDPLLQGRKVQGVPVRGTAEDLRRVAEAASASYAVMAIPSAGPEPLRRIADIAEAAGVTLRVVPPVAELVNGEVSMQDVRDIEISDLLPRHQVQTDLADLASLIHGSRVLITGAGGSIGSEIARQVSRLGAARLVLLDHDETHLFDTASGLPPGTIQRLTDIREPLAVERVFQEERPDVVFHAAAHKHVPLLETHPVEAVQTNVFGTRTVVDAAARAGTRRFVFISTDKAVNPSSVMGSSKAVAERVVLTGQRSMTCCAVRFGNVLGSRGSVVPTFVQQIRSGGPVTVTDPRMTRYFMSIPEAVRLVLHAAGLAKGGEIFMLDMGEAVPILALAQRMIRLSGNRPGLDVEIRVTGIRPGEKLAEQLHSIEERTQPTAHPAIVRLTPILPSPEQLGDDLGQLAVALADRDDQATRRTLGALCAPSVAARIPDQRGAHHDVNEVSWAWT